MYILDLLNATNASISTISILSSPTVIVVPAELVFISGRFRVPKHPAFPLIERVMGVMVAPIGPVLATWHTSDMRKEVLVASVILMDVISRVELLTIAWVIAFILRV